jgi:protein-tyrosine phosphatase
VTAPLETRAPATRNATAASPKGMIDLHNHLLPAVDDGSASLAQSAEAIEQMTLQGMRGLVVTPHFRASTLLREAEIARRLELFDEAWKALRAMVSERFAEVSVHLGTELMLDQPNPDLSHHWIRLAGTRFVLMEFPGMLVPPRAEDALTAILKQGYRPVIAHPERYRNLSADGNEFAAWKKLGAVLQVNCGSLLGAYGADVSRRAWGLLQSGSADYLASDYHARGRYPLEDCRRVLRDEGSEVQGELLLCTNPARLIAGEEPEEVPPARPKASPWQRLVRRGRFWSA